MKQAALRIIICLGIMLATYAVLPQPKPVSQPDRFTSTGKLIPKTYSLVIEQYEAIDIVERNLTYGDCVDAMAGLPYSACELEEPI